MINAPGVYIVEGWKTSVKVEIYSLNDAHFVCIYREKLPRSSPYTYEEFPLDTLHTNHFIVRKLHMCDILGSPSWNLVIETAKDPYTNILINGYGFHEFKSTARIVGFHLSEGTYFADADGNCYLHNYKLVINNYVGRAKLIKASGPIDYIDKNHVVTGQNASASLMFEYDDIIDYQIDGEQRRFTCEYPAVVYDDSHWEHDLQLIRRSGERTRLTADIYARIWEASFAIIGIKDMEICRHVDLPMNRI